VAGYLLWTRIVGCYRSRRKSNKLDLDGNSALSKKLAVFLRSFWLESFCHFWESMSGCGGDEEKRRAKKSFYILKAIHSLPGRPQQSSIRT
jgi:hypothetical protein